MECPNCAHQTQPQAWRCTQCASVFDFRAVEEYSHLGYMRAKLRLWEERREFGPVTARTLSRLATEERERLLRELGLKPAKVAALEPAAAPAAAAPHRAEAPVPPREKAPPSVPTWLTEQAPNILMYLGAFLVVMAALVFVGASGEAISGAVRVAMLASFTAAFVAIGWICYRFPRVRMAGYTFLAVGALLVPLNFAAAHNFVLKDEGIAGDVVWLWASVYSLLFYLLLAVLGLGILYGFMSHAALVSAVAAAVVVSGLSVEWGPPVFVGLGIVTLATAWWAPTRLQDTFWIPSLTATHFLAVASIVATFAMAAAVEGADPAAIPVTLASATFLFAVLAFTNTLEQQVPYGYVTYAGLTSALGAGLVVLPMPVEWIPPVFAGLAIALLSIGRWAPYSVRESFGLPALEFAPLLAAGSAIGASAVTPAVADAERTALPVSLALASAVFGLLAVTEEDEKLATGVCPLASLITAGGALLSIVFVLDKQPEFYSVALVGIAGLYALAGALPLRLHRFEPEILWSFALAVATIAWLPFFKVHDREPWFGLGVTWGAGALYLAAAALMVPLKWLRAVYDGLFPTVPGEGEREIAVEAWASPLLLFPFAATVGLGYFRLLTATAGDLSAEELALRYLPLALTFAVAGMAARPWRRDWSVALYAAALGFSIFVLGASYSNFGQTAVFMTVFAFAAAVVALWERESNLSYLAVAYGLFALVFGLAHFEPADEVWPWPFAGLGVLLYGSGLFLLRAAPRWGQPLRLSGLAIALFAPNVGFGLLSFRISEATDIGETLPVAEPPLYLWSTGAVAFFGLLLAAEAGRIRSLLLGYASSVVLLTALLLGIGHFQLENPQPYVVPIALFMLATARLLSDRRKFLPEDVALAPDLTEVTAGVVLLGTTLVQTFGEHGTIYRFVLLGETIAYLLVGLLLRRRLMVVPALAFAALSGALFAFEIQAEGAPPPWAILAIVGVALLGLGFLFLVRRDFWQRAQEMAVNWWQSWET
jgi:hypothetical protein